MMVLISYDVSTVDASGKTRLRKVAKECQNYGQRVQNSVFETNLDYSTFLKLKDRLINLIDQNKDCSAIRRLFNLVQLCWMKTIRRWEYFIVW